MFTINQKTYKTVLDALWLSGGFKLAAPYTQGQGVIFTLHQVNPAAVPAFSPNAILKVTPDFLEQTIKTVIARGYDIITLDEMHNRLNAANGEPAKQSRPFVVFTFDDGYRDNREHALPIFKKYNIPMTIYVVSDYSAHKGELWWLALEEIIAAQTKVEDPTEQGKMLAAETTKQKYAAFDHIYWKIRHGDQHEQRRLIRRMAERHDFDIDALTRREIMNWDELRSLADEPLVHLAGHTKSHFAMAHLTDAEARSEIVEGLDVMERELGHRPVHFSYPYGDCRSAGQRDFHIASDLGLKTAVTTRKGVIFPAHKEHATALPRVSLNGEYQKQRYVELFLSGVPFFLRNAGKRLNVS